MGGMRTVRLGIVASAVMTAAAATMTVGAPPAAGYTISGTYVTGISSGAYLATQLHVAYSSTVRGSAMFAGGPYYCARGSLTQAQLACMNDLSDNQLPT